MDETPTFLDQPARGSRKRIISIVLIVAGSLLILGGGAFFLTRGPEEETVVSPTPSPLIEETPSPIPEPEFQRSDIKLQVLNGIGTAGTAGKAKSFLEGLGYKDVAVGNADSFDFRKTEIRIKESKKDFLETLRADLAEEYELASSSKTLSESSEFDAVIVIGGPAPSPTPTPTPTSTQESSPAAQSTGSASPQ